MAWCETLLLFSPQDLSRAGQREEGYGMRQEVYRVSHTRDAKALRDACKREGCPICLVVLEEMDDAMDSWNYEGFSDVEHRHALIHSRGFCPLHTWQLAERPNAFQLGLVYRDILSDLLTGVGDLLQRSGREQKSAPLLSGQPARSSSLRAWWRQCTSIFRPPPSTADPSSFYAGCPLYHTRTNRERRVTETLVIMLSLEQMQALLGQSTSLCRLHFQQAFSYAQHHHPAQQQALLTCQQACVQRALEEVSEQIRKHDYRFINEPCGEEMTAWRRAAQLCAGNRGVH